MRIISADENVLERVYKSYYIGLVQFNGVTHQQSITSINKRIISWSSLMQGCRRGNIWRG